MITTPEAFKMYGLETIYDSETGAALPDNWAGLCRWYFKSGATGDFETRIDQNGEREWRCVSTGIVGQ